MSPTQMIKIATRSSPQAWAQSLAVAEALNGLGYATELVPVETTGDQQADAPLHVIGGQGVFVKEVQRAVVDGRCDLAVHSAKDLPSTAQSGLVIGAMMQRRSPADALIGARLEDLAEGATVASGSVRRRAQLARRRPDLNFIELRGNIAGRLSKIPPDGAIVMAVAALEILNLTDRIAEVLDPVLHVPAVGQGCVAVEVRSDDQRLIEILEQIEDPATRACVEVERAFLAELGSGCSLPVGAWSTNGHLHTFLASSDAGVQAEADLVYADEVVALTGDHNEDLERARQAAVAARDHVGGLEV
jgi:hydroxymethylbilane synthase